METYRYNIHLDPKFADSHIHLGVLLYRLKKFSEAVTHLDEAVRLTPKQPEPHIVLGLAHFQVSNSKRPPRRLRKGSGTIPRRRSPFQPRHGLRQVESV